MCIYFAPLKLFLVFYGPKLEHYYIIILYIYIYVYIKLYICLCVHIFFDRVVARILHTISQIIKRRYFFAVLFVPVLSRPVHVIDHQIS